MSQGGKGPQVSTGGTWETVSYSLAFPNAAITGIVTATTVTTTVGVGNTLNKNNSVIQSGAQGYNRYWIFIGY